MSCGVVFLLPPCLFPPILHPSLLSLDEKQEKGGVQVRYIVVVVVVVVVVFTLKNHPGLVFIQPPSVSTSISVLILSLNTVNFRGHKLTYLEKVY